MKNQDLQDKDLHCVKMWVWVDREVLDEIVIEYTREKEKNWGGGWHRSMWESYVWKNVSRVYECSSGGSVFSWLWFIDQTWEKTK